MQNAVTQQSLWHPMASESHPMSIPNATMKWSSQHTKELVPRPLIMKPAIGALAQYNKNDIEPGPP